MHFGLEQHCCCLIGNQIFENLASLEYSSKDGISLRSHLHQIWRYLWVALKLLCWSKHRTNMDRLRRRAQCYTVCLPTQQCYHANKQINNTKTKSWVSSSTNIFPIPSFPKNANSHHPARPGTHPAKPIITHTYATPHTTHSLPLNTLPKRVVTATKPVPPAISAVATRRPVRVGTEAKSRSGRTRRKGRSFVSWLEVVVGGGGGEGEIRSSRRFKNSASTSHTGWCSSIQAL